MIGAGISGLIKVPRGAYRGRWRLLPRRNVALIDEVKAANAKTPRGTLVEGASLKGAFDDYKTSMQKAGLFHGHGLRHDYAQRRYSELIRSMCPPGVEPWECPKKGAWRKRTCHQTTGG